MNRQLIRNIIQLLFIGLTALGLFINIQWTMTVIMILVILSGAVYCGWICPFGTLQEYSAKLGRFLGIKKKKVPKPIHNILKNLRYIVLAVVTLMTTSLIFDIMSYEPRNNFINMLTGNIPAVLGAVVILGFVILSMFYERFYCKYLCYEGAKFGLFSLLRPVTIHKSDSCIQCKKCDRSCPMDIEVSQFKVLRSPNCITCLKCVDACPVDNTLTFGFKKKGIFNRSYLMIIVSIILCFFAFKVVSGDNHHTPEDVNTDIVYELNGVEYLDGVYSGSGVGFKGNVFVEVTVTGGQISEIKVTDHSDDSKWFNRAADLIDIIIKTQTADVDLVSGATYSSRGIRDAVINALESAVKPETSEPTSVDVQLEEAAVGSAEAIADNTETSVDNTEATSLYKDGTYSGTAKGFNGDITVSVTIESDEIIDVVVTDHRDDRKWYNRAVAIIDDIMSSQSTDVDLVSGATYSSRGIRDAVNDALEKAK